MGSLVKQQIPPLAFGDKLTREEFLRRWELHPEIKFAELIGGIVYMPSPLSVAHGDMGSMVGTWLCHYSAETPGTRSGNNTTSLLLGQSPQPDHNLRILPEFGGGSRVEDSYLGGTPELLAEICRSSASYDLHVKLDLYQEAKVPEYLAILLYENEIRWHILDQGVYRVQPPGPDGVWRSKVFPGLWLDGDALLEDNMSQVLAKLQEGLNSPEHRAFVEQLAAKKKK